MRYNKLEDLIIAELTILNNIDIKFNNIAIINSTLSSILIKSTGFLEQKLHKVFCHRNENDKEFRNKVFEHAFTPNKYLPRSLSGGIIEKLLEIPEKYIDSYCTKNNMTDDDKKLLESKINNFNLSSQKDMGAIVNLSIVTNSINQYYTKSVQDYKFLRNHTMNITLERILELFSDNDKDIYEFVDSLKNRQWLSESEYDSEKIKSLFDTRCSSTLSSKSRCAIQNHALQYIYDKWKTQQGNIFKNMSIDFINKDSKNNKLLDIAEVIEIIKGIRNSAAHGQIESIKILGMVKGISYFWLFDRLIILDEYIEIKFGMLKEILE